ncbi:MAG: hypothetical protein ACLGI7_13190 [Gammaproteobacteria bacterium]
MKSTRMIVALVLCCALALARMLGIHVHVAHEHPTTVEEMDVGHDHEHDHGVARVVSEIDHLDSHLSHAEVDADTADTTAGKLPSLMLLALAVCVATLLVAARQRVRWRACYESPPLRRRPHVLPLSQAPPLAG